MDGLGLEYTFCAGKATWYEEIATLFGECRIALETGILPDKGGIKDQSEMFIEVFPEFVSRWRERSYNRVWQDTREYSQAVLEAIFGKSKG